MNKTFALIGICFVAFTAFLDYTIINTALPTLQKAFSTSVLQLQWLFNIYSMVMASCMVIFGRLGDIYGRRLLFYIGIAIIAIGSLGAGLSYSFSMLIFFRVIQSIGIATAVTLAIGLITQVFGRENMHCPMGIYVAVTGIALATGPYIGGLLVTYFSWHWLFLINIPLLIIGALFCLRNITETKSEHKIPLDLLGGALLAGSILCLVFGLIHGENTRWTTHTTILSLCAAIILIAAFLWFERRQSQPIMNTNFFAIPRIRLATLTCIMAGGLISTAILFMPLFFHSTVGYSPKEAGLALLVMPIALVFFSPFIGQLGNRFGESALLRTALLIATISAALLLVTTSSYSLSIAIVAFLLVGLAWVITNAIGPVAVIKSVEPAHCGAAIGTVLSFWNIAAAITLAITSVLFHHFSAGGTLLKFNLGIHAVFIFLFLFILALFLMSFLVEKKGRGS